MLADDMYILPTTSKTFIMGTPTTSLFPVSNSRSEPLPTLKRKRSIPPPIQPSVQAPQPTTSAFLKSSEPIPQRTNYKGVYRIGDTFIPSQDATIVQNLIAHMNTHWELPSAQPSDAILALAALSVSIHPTQPAHWVLWHDKIRAQTITLCKNQLAKRPQTIQWTGNGTFEDYTVTRYQTEGWHAHLASQPWYPVLAKAQRPKKKQLESAVATRRTRRTAAQDTPTLSTIPSPQEDAPPLTKRARTQPKRKVNAPESESISARQATSRQSPSPLPPPLRASSRTRPQAPMTSPETCTSISSSSSISKSPTSVSATLPSRQRSNSQNSGTLVGSDRSMSVSTVEATPSPRNEKELLIEVVEDAPRRSTRSGKGRRPPPIDKPMPTLRTARPRSEAPPQTISIDDSIAAPGTANAEATDLGASKPAPRTRPVRARARASRK